MSRARRAAVCGLLLALPSVGRAPALGAQATLYRSPAFEVTRTGVRQGAFEARAFGRDTIASTYPRAAREVHFKFAIGGADNEFPPGIEHVVNLRPRGGVVTTPTYVFGRPPVPALPRPEQAGEGEDGPARLTIRLDLRAALAAIRETGSFTPPQGALVRRVTPVFVIGDTDPLVWDVRLLRPGAPQELTDPDGDGIFETTLTFRPEYLRPLGADGRARWTRTRDLAGMPALASPEPILDATYRLALEELLELRRPDGALSAGAKWPGVWTRDVALASVLGLAFVAPDAVRTSLLMKVDARGRIIQDTGTGGSWPVSTDRMTWALAAWEVYAVTGDRAWLRQAYDIIARSAEADRHAAFDAATGLFRGETSFLDWREQSYPRWMQPADIFHSQALGTNAVHHGAYTALAAMARELALPAPVVAEWERIAAGIRRGVAEELWMPSRGRHAPFRAGWTTMQREDRFEALGEALAILTGVTPPSRRDTVLARAPLMSFGTPTLHPAIPGIPYYHNGSIWPFVTAYWTWAAADARAAAAVEHGLAAMTRGSALFLTNKENLVAETGHFEGTALNSDRQLWSVAGSLAMQYRVLFGMRAERDRLRFAPMVPPAYAGTRELRGVRYRGAELTVRVVGSGDAVARATLDGRPLARPEVPATLTGAHVVELRMNGRWRAGPLTLATMTEQPAMAEPSRAGVAGDGVSARPRVRAALDSTESLGEVVEAVLEVPARGWYAISAEYRNGHGPVNTEDKAAVRTLRVDGREAGVLVLPQRGAGRWDDLGRTNPVVVMLEAGPRRVTLARTALDANMNGVVNDARVDRILAEPAPAPSQQAPAVHKVEPPDWWVGHSVNPVRLLVRGAGLRGARATCGTLTCGPTRVSASGTHLFVDVTIAPGTPPGTYPVRLETEAGGASFDFRVHAPVERAGRFAGIGAEDVLYLIMPDRFANGDARNDDPAKSRGLHRRADARHYHGGDLEGVRRKLPYLKALGVTAIWLTPIQDNVDTVAHRTRQAWAPNGYTDYHGYGATDLYAVDEHFGDLAAYRRLVDEAHALGLKVVMDLVANHTGPEHPWALDPPTPTWFAGSPGRHLPNNWQMDALADPHVAAALRDSTLRGWFADILPDFDQDDPEVRQYLIQQTLWWVATTGVDAVRQDTWPYVPRAFWRSWMAAIKREHPTLTVVAEVLNEDPKVVAFFEGSHLAADGIRTGVDQVFDFPLQAAARRVFMHGASVRQLAQVLAQDRLYDAPERLVTVTDNHDMPRLASEGSRSPEALRLAYTFLLTTRGIPQLYYGNEIGLPGTGDPDNRRDFPGGWPGDARDAFTEAGRTPEEQRTFAHVQALLALRRVRPELATVRTEQLLVEEQVLVSRRGATVVAINNGDVPATVRVRGLGALGPAVIGGCGAPRVEDGAAVLTLAARAGCVF